MYMSNGYGCFLICMPSLLAEMNPRKLNCIRLRSNALLLTMFTVPEMPSAGLAGVGTLVTSMRDMLFTETCVKRKLRLAALPEALAMAEPSIVTDVMLGSKPRTATALGDASEYSIVTPGRNFMNSATLPSVT